MEKVEYFLGKACIYALCGLKIGQIGAGNGLGAAEMGQKRTFAPGPHTGDFIQWIGR
jgi:hypothetical protein